jgi:hypothetical protein
MTSEVAVDMEVIVVRLVPDAQTSESRRPLEPHSDSRRRTSAKS